ncbi:hypothetical protein M407DRAFT_69333 [Tulasnella calospora MUT 4182]|uniref:Cysteine proteinase 1, mitochondrial n=1 Tax=Tulasnella calospora MUT 4182 TaxID=1051891 RepID=A0A0C3QRH6_9AGAM|nr:hypothetical protein M407DRAFT_69333 [Tulasnella calospora MUT 4182]
MGAQQSKQTNPTPIQTVDEKVVLKEQATLISALERFSVSDDTEPASADGTVNYQELKQWEEEAIKDSKTSVSRAVLDHVDMSTALLSRAARVADTHVFNLKLDYEATPITNQLSSGRCWLFASTNVIRYDAAQKLKIKDFQLSQSYLFFYDKLEKSNHFLELSIEHADLPLDSRLITHLNSDPVGDGGQLDMAVNLIEVHTSLLSFWRRSLFFVLHANIHSDRGLLALWGCSAVHFPRILLLVVFKQDGQAYYQTAPRVFLVVTCSSFWASRATPRRGRRTSKGKVY